MEVITLGKARIASNNTDLMRKERIMFYTKMISESVGGEKRNDEH